MLVGKTPFHRIVCKQHSDRFTLHEKYQFFYSNNDQYWQKYCNQALNMYIAKDVKNLIHSMLKLNHNNRISIAQIMFHKWYLAKPAILGEELKNMIEDELTAIDKMQAMNSEQSNGGLQTLPLWLNRACKSQFEYTTVRWQSIFDAFRDVVTSQFKGTAKFNKETQGKVLICSVREPFEVQFSVTVFQSDLWNYIASDVFAILITPVSEKDLQFHVFKPQMMQNSQIRKVITGVPIDVNMETDTKTNYNDVNAQVHVEINSDQVCLFKIKYQV